ncbi:type II secretion system protein GspD [Candidatus Magnetaquicoccus inordinatus]|uniref:type II secretion system protein GspD n=1 Tax=Candidatus Magnetaquicoccus inordinatus TaxID=2496818 RepID=UPI00102B152F|nr:secretin N-terminal domain-containing protein [Candidatus Magnetaquicoccus inordinatus]
MSGMGSVRETKVYTDGAESGAEEEFPLGQGQGETAVTAANPVFMRKGRWLKRAALFAACGLLQVMVAGQPLWADDERSQQDLDQCLRKIIGESTHRPIGSLLDNVKNDCKWEYNLEQINPGQMVMVDKKLLEQSKEKVVDYIAKTYNWQYVISGDKSLTFKPKSQESNKKISGVFSPVHGKVTEIWQSWCEVNNNAKCPGKANKNSEGKDNTYKELIFKVDSATNTIYVSGNNNDVTNMLNVFKGYDAGVGNLKKIQQRENMQSLEKTMQNWTYVRIPLRYANVDRTTRTFQGKSYEIPGIIESLKLLTRAVDAKDFQKLQGGSGQGWGQMMGGPGAWNPQGTVPGGGAAAAGAATGASGNGVAEGALPGGEGKVDFNLMDPTTPVVAADRRTNSVIVWGVPAAVEKIRKLIVEDLDKQENQIEIEVMILEGQHDLSASLGVDWGYAQGIHGAGAFTGNTSLSGVGYSNVSTGRGQLQLVSNPSIPATGGAMGFLFQGSRYMLDATLKAMESSERLQTISSPRVVTMENIPAKITSSKNLSFQFQADDSKARSNITTVQTGVSIDILPMVIKTKDGEVEKIRLDISAKSSAPSTLPSGIAAAGVSVTTDEQEIHTNVFLPQGSTFILGGMFKTVRGETDRGVPGLRSIPLLGNLFNYRKSDNKRSEVVFLITPRVLNPLVAEENTLPADDLRAANEEILQESLSSRSFIKRERGAVASGMKNLHVESPLLPMSRSRAEDE